MADVQTTDEGMSPVGLELLQKSVGSPAPPPNTQPQSPVGLTGPQQRQPEEDESPIAMALLQRSVGELAPPKPPGVFDTVKDVVSGFLGGKEGAEDLRAVPEAPPEPEPVKIKVPEMPREVRNVFEHALRFEEMAKAGKFSLEQNAPAGLQIPPQVLQEARETPTLAQQQQTQQRQREEQHGIRQPLPPELHELRRQPSVMAPPKAEERNAKIDRILPPTEYPVGNALVKGAAAANIESGAYLNSVTLGGLDLALHAFGKERLEADPNSLPEQASEAVGQLGGFIAGPGRWGARGFQALAGQWLTKTGADTVTSYIAKQASEEVGAMTFAVMMERTGHAVGTGWEKGLLEAMTVEAEAAKDGALLGATFGGAKYLVPGNGMLRAAARFGIGSAAIDAAQGTHPFDERTLAQKIVAYGLNAFMMFKGANSAAEVRKTIIDLKNAAAARQTTIDEIVRRTVQAKQFAGEEEFKRAYDFFRNRGDDEMTAADKAAKAILQRQAGRQRYEETRPQGEMKALPPHEPLTPEAAKAIDNLVNADTQAKGAKPDVHEPEPLRPPVEIFPERKPPTPEAYADSLDIMRNDIWAPTVRPNDPNTLPDWMRELGLKKTARNAVLVDRALGSLIEGVAPDPNALHIQDAIDKWVKANWLRIHTSHGIPEAEIGKRPEPPKPATPAPAENEGAITAKGAEKPAEEFAKQIKPGETVLLQTPQGEPIARLKMLDNTGRAAGTYEVMEWLGGDRALPYGEGTYRQHFEGRTAKELRFAKEPETISRTGAKLGYLQLAAADAKYLAPDTKVVAPEPTEKPSAKAPPAISFSGLYQGRGASLEQVYGKAAVAEGRAVPVLGQADYFAFKPEDAKRYGEVTRHKFELRNPLVLDTNRKWLQLVQAAGTPHLSSVSREFYTEPGKIPEMTERMQDYIRRQGYDGVVVKNTENEKRLRETFGHDQVVKFRPVGAEPAAPAPKAAEVDDYLAGLNDLGSLTDVGGRTGMEEPLYPIPGQRALPERTSPPGPLTKLTAEQSPLVAKVQAIVNAGKAKGVQAAQMRKDLTQRGVPSTIVDAALSAAFPGGTLPGGEQHGNPQPEVPAQAQGAPGAPARGAEAPAPVQPEAVPPAQARGGRQPTEVAGGEAPAAAQGARTAEVPQAEGATRPEAPPQPQPPAERGNAAGPRPAEAAGQPERGAGEPGAEGTSSAGSIEGGGRRTDVPGADGKLDAAERIVTLRASHTEEVEQDPRLGPYLAVLTKIQAQDASRVLKSMDADGAHLLANGTGTGKSFTGIAIADIYLKQGREVVWVAPASALQIDRVKKKVGGTIKEAAELLKVPVKAVLSGEPIESGVVNVMSYETFKKFQPNPERILFLDEAHYLKNFLTQSQRGMHGVDAANQAKAVLFMTASPLDKALHIAYLEKLGIYEGKTQLEALRELGLYIAGVNKEGYPIYRPMDEEVTRAKVEKKFDRLTKAGRMTTREISLKAVINGKEGQVEVQTLRVLLPPESQAVTQRILDGFAGHPGASEDELPGWRKAVALNLIRLQHEPFKIPATVNLIKREVAEGRKVIVFLNRVNESEAGQTIKIRGPGGEVIDEIREVYAKSEGTAKTMRALLSEAGVKFSELHGGATETRQQAMKNFQEGDAQVILATPGSGGIGISLDDRVGNKPRTMVIMTAPYSGIENIQALGRAWRLNTMSFPKVIYMHSGEMIDERNMTIVVQKMAMLGAAVKTEITEKVEAEPEHGGPVLHNERTLTVEPATEYKGKSLEPLLEANPESNVLVARGPDGTPVGYLWYTRQPGGGFRVNDIRTTGERSGAARALYRAAAAEEGPYRGSDEQTPEGKALVDRLRETDPDIFGGVQAEHADLDEPMQDLQAAAAPGRIRNQWARAATSATQPNGPAGVPVERAALLDKMRKILNIPVRTGRMNPLKRSVLGFFKIRPEVVRTRIENDLPTLAHETGHYVSKLLLGSIEHPTMERNRFMAQHAAALQELSLGHAKPTPEEGLAEWMRFYLTAPNVLQDPRFQPLTQEIEARLGAKDPDMLAALQNWGSEVRAFFGKTLMDRVEASTAWDPITTRRAPAESLRRIYTGMFADIAPVERAVKEMAGGTVPTAADNAAIQMQLLVNVNSLVDLFLKKSPDGVEGGPIDFRTLRKVGKSLEEVLEPVQGDVRKWGSYMLLKRLVEMQGRTDEAARKSARALEVKLNTNWREARNTVRQMETLHPDWRQAHDDYQEWNQHLRDYLVASGRYAAKDMALIAELNEHYFPFHRLLADEERWQAAQWAGGGINRLKGSGKDFLNPIESTIRNTYTLIKQAEVNAALGTLVNQALRAEGSGKFLEKVPPKIRPFTVITEEVLDKVRRDLSAAGVPPEDIAVLSDDHIRALVTVFRADHRALAPNEIIFYRRGKPEHYLVGDPLLNRYLHNLTKPEATLLQSLYEKMGGGRMARMAQIVLEGPARTLRAGVTQSLEFASRNAMRDTIERAILSARNEQHPFPIIGPWITMLATLAELPHGLKSAIGRDQWFDAYKRGGGLMNLPGMDKKSMQRTMDEILKQQSPTRHLNPLKWLRLISAVTEDANRIEEARYLAKERFGVTDPKRLTKAQLREIGFHAFDTPINFMRQGSWVRWLGINKVAAFFGVSLASWDKFFRMFGSHPYLMSNAVFSLITLPSLALVLWNQQDARWKDIPDWQKNTFWIVFTNHMDKERWAQMSVEDRARAIRYGGMNAVIRIPKPWQYGILFGSIPERVLEWMQGHEPEIGHRVMQALWEARVANPLPTGAQVAVSVMRNHDDFFGRPVVPRGMEGIEPEEQVSPGTHQSVEWLAHGISAVSGGKAPDWMRSPVTLDYIVGRSAGNSGRLAADVVDLALRAISSPEAAVPAGTMADIPLIRGFVVDPLRSAESIESFYRIYNDAQTRVKTSAFLRKNDKDAAAYNERNAVYILAAPALSVAARNLNRLRAAQRGVRQDKEMDKDQKRERLDEIAVQMSDVAREAVENFRALEHNQNQ